MSKVKIEGNASGTGTLTISAPNTNTDRALTLPDGAGEILTDASTLSSSNLSGALPAIDGSALTGLSSGLSEVDFWELTANLDCSASTNVNPTGWSRVGHDSSEKIGTGLSHSSGVFTFPSTGYYLITFYACYERNGTASTTYVIPVIETTTNGSSYSDAAANYTKINSTISYSATTVSFVFKVTDTSTHKLRLKHFSDGSVYLMGDTGVTFTSFTTMKLGDV